jgi:hypothetical protein
MGPGDLHIFFSVSSLRLSKFSITQGVPADSISLFGVQGPLEPQVATSTMTEIFFQCSQTPTRQMFAFVKIEDTLQSDHRIPDTVPDLEVYDWQAASNLNTGTL